MYELQYSDDSLSFLEKLSKTESERIFRTLERIRIQPQRSVTRLVGSPYYRLRVGDYRVIVRIDQGNLLILVIEIGHRKNVYK